MNPTEGSTSPNYKIARELARKLLKDAKILTFPVLIKDVARCIPDLKVDGVELADDISGMQISYKGIDFVRYNSRHPSTRNRFTLSHEIGHTLLGHTIDEVGLITSTSQQDSEANCFAAELLMPLDMLKTAMKQYTTISLLAKAFWVSKEAMRNRIMFTKLFYKLTSFD